MTYKCVVCAEWHAVTSIVTFNGQEIRECPNIKEYLPNTDAVVIGPKDRSGLYGDALKHIIGLPKTCNPITNLTPADVTIPDFGEPKKFL